jgi:PAS domain S-box-containing protein
MDQSMPKKGGGAEEALASREQELRLLVETIPALVWRAGPDGNIDYVNKRVLDYLGARLDDIAGWRWVERAHPDDVAFKITNWLKSLETGNPHDVVCRFRGADGRYRWFNVRGEPLRASDGTVLRWYGVLIDIDDRRKAEEALRESEFKLRQIIETVPGFLWSTDPDGELTHVNQRFLDYSGIRFEDFKHGRWEALLRPDDYADIAETFYHAIQTGTSYQDVMRLRRADGEFRWYHVRGEPLRNQQGDIIQWYGLSIDIDEAKKAEDRLRRSEAHLTEAQRLSHTGASAYNQSQILYWSEETYRIWGFDPAQGIPSREAVLQRVHPDDRDRLRAEAEGSFGEKKGLIGYRIVLPDGTVKHLESISQPMFSVSGELVEVVATHADVTERKRAEEALRESEAKIRRLVDANIIGIVIWDLEGRIIEANDAYLRMVEYDREDIASGRIRWTELTPSEWRERDERVVAELRSNGTFQPFEKEYFRKDGSRIPVLIGGALFEESGSEGVAFVLDLTERKCAEQALRESEYKLRQIIETIPSLVWSADPDFEVTHLNQRHLDYYGMQLEDFKRGGWKAFQHPDDLPESIRAISHAVRTGTSFQAVHRIRRADGEFRWHDSRGAPLRDRQGNIIQWYGLTIDIDEAKKAEDRLRRSEAYLAQAQRLGQSGVSAYNETTILYGSEESYRIWGFDPAQGVPSREAVFERIHPGDRDRLNEEVQRAVGEKRGYSIGYRIVLPDGTVKHLESIGQPMFSASGELVEIVTTQIDVTERKRAEQALRESEAKFRDYAETASDWFWEIGPDYKFTLLTENAFGAAAAHRLGTPCWDHALDFESEPEKWRQIWAALDSRKPFRDFVYRSMGRNGPPMYVKASGKPVFDSNGEFRGYRGTGTDVTALMRAQEEHERLRRLESDLAHMNRLSMMGELAASLAHEIAQPIAAARNNARAATHFLDRSPPDLGQVREALTCVLDDADRAGDILDRIRDHIKKAPPRMELVDVNQAISDVIALAQGAIIKNGVSVQICLTEGLSDVQADCVQLQQVVLNLILNAVEAMSSIKNGVRELSISTEQHKTGGVLVSVRDSGPGIDQKHLDRVFDAFYTTKSSGVGMGLSICRSIVDAHGGRLWADMNASRGAVFRFTLPGADKELTDSRRPAHVTREPHEDTASDAAHRPAYEGNQRPHR